MRATLFHNPSAGHKAVTSEMVPSPPAIIIKSVPERTARALTWRQPGYFAVTPRQVLNFISTSTSTGYVSLTEMS